ncbi:MAG: GntR family transcriptional regulator [Clostridiales bacterium]|nr:GntR family transcriptional regulator [Clostridiales bacterium]
MPAKYVILARLLREELSANGSQPGYRLPTEEALSRRYGMSRQTVRHALQLLVEDGIIEKRRGSGSYLSDSQAAAPPPVAIVVTFVDEYIFPTVLHNAQQVFAQYGYPTVVYSTENQIAREREILQTLLSDPVSSILIEGSKTALPCANEDLFRELQYRGIPLLFFQGRYESMADFPYVCDDNFGGGMMLAQHLVGRGHRQIGGIFKSDDMQGPQRYHGLTAGLVKAGLPVSDRHFCWYGTEERLSLVNRQDGGFLQSFLRERLDDVTAIVCYNDEIAHFLIRELLTMGRWVPEDVAVVSFDNSYYSQMEPVSITSLSHYKQKTGQVAAQLLLELIHGQSCRSRLLDWRLMVRSSG